MSVCYGSLAAPQDCITSTAAIGGEAVIALDSIQHGLFDNEHPSYARCSIIQFTSIQSLPYLIR